MKIVVWNSKQDWSFMREREKEKESEEKGRFQIIDARHIFLQDAKPEDERVMRPDASALKVIYINKNRTKTNN